MHPWRISALAWTNRFTRKSFREWTSAVRARTSARLTLAHESAHAAAGINSAAAPIAMPVNVFFVFVARIKSSRCFARIALIGRQIRA